MIEKIIEARPSVPGAGGGASRLWVPLSENAADFAEACANAGIVFIGPPPGAIRAMGSKAAAKALMERSGVPLVPGYHGADQDASKLATEAGKIGYPVLIKASAGGGGKGMRVVERAADLDAAIAGAKREAAASFGDDRVLIEKYLTQPRHIEIQVFADTHGNCVSLFERDCSIQRRHQKVIEEAPAPGMDATHGGLRWAKRRSRRRVLSGDVGAGTVEFIAEFDKFYFMEMNTRLQVEHPVTEMITGQELVEWQLRVAAGEKLPLTQEEIGIRGHAIEARIYAEDPARDFLPSTGTLVHLRQPRESTHVRVDTGVREGDAITPNYDPMIAKLIVWGEDRAAAVARLAGALAEYEVVGVRTNLALLRAIAAHPAYAAAMLDTGFIGRHAKAVMPVVAAAFPDDVARFVWAGAALALLGDLRAAQSDDTRSPWGVADAWRMNGDGYQDIRLSWGDATGEIRAYPQADGGYRLVLPAGSVCAEATEDATGMRLRLDGVLRRVRVVRRGAELVVILAGANHLLRYVDPLAPPRQDAAGDDRLTAPIPARVARVLVKVGDVVKKGALLLVLEAMKMEMSLVAPIDGTIGSVRHGVDEMVEEGTELISFATLVPLAYPHPGPPPSRGREQQASLLPPP